MAQGGGQAGRLVLGQRIGDEALVVDALREPQAFWMLYERYVDAIYWYALPRTRSKAAADDIVGETMLAAFEHLDSFDPAKGSFSTWLFVIARRKIADHHRYHQRLWRHIRRRGTGRDNTVHDDSLDRLIRDEEIDEVYRAFSQLKPDDQDVLALRYASELSAREIGQILDASEGAIRQRLARARRRLAAQLGRRSVEGNGDE